MTVNILLGARYLEKSGYKTQENESWKKFPHCAKFFLWCAKLAFTRKFLPGSAQWGKSNSFGAKILIPNKYLEFGSKGLVFCRNNGWLMENMDKCQNGCW